MDKWLPFKFLLLFSIENEVVPGGPLYLLSEVTIKGVVAVLSNHSTEALVVLETGVLFLSYKKKKNIFLGVFLSLDLFEFLDTVELEALFYAFTL